MKVKNILKTLAPLALIFPFLTSTTSCAGGGVRFANYESYMSTNLMERLRETHDIQFLTYESNETLEIKFSRSYDIAIPSTYEVINLLKLDKLEKIDWSKFDLHYDLPDGKSKKIETVEEAKEMLTPEIITLIDSIDEKYKDDADIKKIIGNEEFHILDWAIPYFLQSFLFGYKGEECASLTGKDKYKMSEILDTVSKEERFGLASGKGKVGICDDYRTIYGAAKTITQPGVNPIDEEIEGQIESIENVYKEFTQHFESGQCNLNSDSGMLVSTFVDPKGMNGLFSYNGDMLYASTGAEIVDPFTSDNFHVPTLENSLLAFDMVVINTGQRQEKQAEIYSVIKEAILDGLDNTTSADFDDVDAKHIYDENEKGEFVYGPMENFDFVMYTSPYQKINSYAMDGEYFSTNYTDVPEDIAMMKSIYNIKTDVNSINYLENPLKNLTKSNMEIAWRKMKNNI